MVAPSVQVPGNVPGTHRSNRRNNKSTRPMENLWRPAPTQSVHRFDVVWKRFSGLQRCDASRVAMPMDVNADERIRAIALATLDVASERGSAGVTLRAVAERLGGSTTLVTNYLKSRAELSGQRGRSRLRNLG